jgi:hypothetical protein
MITEPTEKVFAGTLAVLVKRAIDTAPTPMLATASMVATMRAIRLRLVFT